MHHVYVHCVIVSLFEHMYVLQNQSSFGSQQWLLLYLFAYSECALYADFLFRPFFFDYLVYGSADPILQDFEKKKKKKKYIFLI